MQKVYASINRETGRAEAIPGESISLQRSPRAVTQSPPELARSVLRPMNVYAPDTGSYRVALRSSAIDASAFAAVAALVDTSRSDARVSAQISVSAPTPGPAASSAPALAAEPPAPNENGVFVPQVRGPNDSATTTAQVAPGGLDRADLRKGHADAAFVF